jgi:hypothetical protein
MTAIGHISNDAAGRRNQRASLKYRTRRAARATSLPIAALSASNRAASVSACSIS